MFIINYLPKCIRLIALLGQFRKRAPLYESPSLQSLPLHMHAYNSLNQSNVVLLKHLHGCRVETDTESHVFKP